MSLFLKSILNDPSEYRKLVIKCTDLMKIEKDLKNEFDKIISDKVMDLLKKVVEQKSYII